MHHPPARTRLSARVAVLVVAGGVAVALGGAVFAIAMGSPPPVREVAASMESKKPVASAAPSSIERLRSVQALEAELYVHDAPDGQPRWLLGNPGPFDGVLTLEATGNREGDWVEVVVPVQPNGTTGWVELGAVRPISVNSVIRIDLSDRWAQLYVDDSLVAEAPVAVGAAETPTPALSAMVDHVQRNSDPSGLYGSWLFGTNQHSEVLSEFDGGRPAIALHGTNAPELIGQEVSNGCIRFTNDDIELFAPHIELGTRVEMRP